MIAVRIQNVLNKIDNRINELRQMHKRTCESRIIDRDVKDMASYVARMRISELCDIKEYIIKELDLS